MTVDINWQPIIGAALLAIGGLWFAGRNMSTVIGWIMSGVNAISSADTPAATPEAPKPDPAQPATVKAAPLDSDARPGADVMRWVKAIHEAAGSDDAVFRAAITNGDAVIDTYKRRVETLEKRKPVPRAEAKS